MSRQFSLQTVLRMTPNPLLEQYFRALGHGDFDPKWSELRKQEVDPLLNFIENLPPDQHNEAESVLRTVFDLACESGFQAILEAAAESGLRNLGAMIPGDLPLYGVSMWAWLNYREVFDQAQSIHRIDQMPWWRKRSDLPRKDPDHSQPALELLELNISHLLKSQGRGKDCTVETRSRGGIDYYFAYPDDFVENVTVHDENGRLAPELFRKTMLIVFAYNRHEGTLETFAKLPKAMKEKLETIFAAAILDFELPSFDPRTVYELNPLKDESFDLSTDPADCVNVRIRKIRLSAKSKNGRRILLEVDDDDPHDNIHKAIRECINLEEVSLSEWNVTLATFCFDFLPLAGRKVGQFSFDVIYPHSCSLRSARTDRVEIVQKYLRRWNIDRAPDSEADHVEVGDEPAGDWRGGDAEQPAATTSVAP
jgi:hypothetical protein